MCAIASDAQKKFLEMARADLDAHFAKIDALIAEIDKHVPAGEGYQEVRFRADLAGLLVVAIVATYESCVKEVLISYAKGRHSDFGQFASNHYDHLNSRIKVADLKRYCKLFSPEIEGRFKDKLNKRKSLIPAHLKKDINDSYEQLLDWRHEFAHALNNNTTIEEAAKTHLFGKRVLYAFDEAFSEV